MKDILNKVGESLKHTVKEAGNQTQKTVDQTVYRADLLKAKNELKKLYEDLGKSYYESYLDKQVTPISQAICDKIAYTLDKIESINQSIDNLVKEQKDSFSCFKREVKTTWHEEMAEQSRPDVNSEGLEVMKFCVKCNAGNNINADYCINCGSEF